MTESEFVELAKKGDRAAVETALQEEPTLANAQEGEVSAILWSVYYGHAEIGRVIAEARRAAQHPGLDIYEAAALGDQHVAADLLKTDPKLVNKHNSDGFTPLGLAAFFGHLEMVKMLLKAGADPNIASDNSLGVLPLHSALSNGSKEIARTLVDAGTDVNAASREGWTALHYTAHKGDRQTTDYLLNKGARKGGKNKDGQTPETIAESEGHSDLAQLLRG